MLRENRVIEALIGSAAHGNGIVRVMKALRHEAPAPEVLRDRLQAQAGLGEAPLAVVFASAYRKHVGKTLLLRALAPLAAGHALGGKAPGSSPRPTRATATTSTRSPRARSSAPSSPTTSPPAASPPPTELIAPPTGTGRSRRSCTASSRRRTSATASSSRARSPSLAEGDAALTVTQDPATGGALVGVQGPLHLRILRQRLKDGFGMEVEEVMPAPAYRETISKSQETAYRHKKQTGGAGQFADVRLVVAPAERGAGFAFAEVVKGGAVPRNYIPAVEAGARDAMDRGPLGFPVLDVAVTLTDGQAHAVDSSDMAFRIAGRQGTREALKAAGPVLLQPVFRIAIHAPAMFTGASARSSPRTPGRSSASTPTRTPRAGSIYDALVPGRRARRRSPTTCAR